MTTADFLLTLDDLLERSPGATRLDEPLGAITKWDSMAVIAFIALADEKFGVQVKAMDLASCRTIEDLQCLLGGQVR